jgi:hypothetical protein
MPPRPRAPLRLVPDPQHPGAFVVRHVGTLSVLLVGGLLTGLCLVGALVRLNAPEPMSLGRYVARELGLLAWWEKAP